MARLCYNFRFLLLHLLEYIKNVCSEIYLPATQLTFYSEMIMAFGTDYLV